MESKLPYLEIFQMSRPFDLSIHPIFGIDPTDKRTCGRNAMFTKFFTAVFFGNSKRLATFSVPITRGLVKYVMVSIL